MRSNFENAERRFETAIRLIDIPCSQRQALIDEYARRATAAFAPTTQRNLREIRAMFTSWCVEHQYDPEPPIKPTVVAEYVDFLGGKVRPNTIETRLWAIGEMHKSRFMASPCHHPLVDLALKAVKRRYGAAVRQAAPLCKRDVLEAIARLGRSQRDIRDAALLWVATDSWCRSSELIAFKVRDLLVQPDGTSLLFISRSKTDQYGEGAYGYVSALGTEAVQEWIAKADLKANDPIFTKSQKGALRTPLDPATVSRIFKRCTGRKDVSAHSTRVGGVQDALTLGCNLASIMVAGRWSSPEMPAQYGRRILAGQSAAAKVSQAYGVP